MRDTVTVIHRAAQGLPDYVFHLTFDFQKEYDQWVGECLELGTAAHSDSLEQVQEELGEAVELQLDGMEQLCNIRDYLKDNGVHIVPIGADALFCKTGFAVAPTILY